MDKQALISAIHANRQSLTDRQAQLASAATEMVTQSQEALRLSYALLARTYRQSQAARDGVQKPN